MNSSLEELMEGREVDIRFSLDEPNMTCKVLKSDKDWLLVNAKFLGKTRGILVNKSQIIKIVLEPDKGIEGLRFSN